MSVKLNRSEICGYHKSRRSPVYKDVHWGTGSFQKASFFRFLFVSGKTSDIAFLFNMHLSLADCRYLCTINTMQRYISIGTALASKLRLSAPLHHTASIAVRGITVPISICFLQAAATRSVGKRK